VEKGSSFPEAKPILDTTSLSTYGTTIKKLLSKEGLDTAKGGFTRLIFEKGDTTCNGARFPIAIQKAGNDVIVILNNTIFEGSGEEIEKNLGEMIKLVVAFFKGDYQDLIVRVDGDTVFLAKGGGAHVGGARKKLLLLTPCEGYLTYYDELPGQYKIENKRLLCGKLATINVSILESLGGNPTLKIEVKSDFRELNGCTLQVTLLNKLDNSKIINAYDFYLPELKANDIVKSLVEAKREGAVPIELKRRVEDKLKGLKEKGFILPKGWERMVTADCIPLPLAPGELRRALEQYDREEKAAFAVCVDEGLRNRIELDCRDDGEAFRCTLTTTMKRTHTILQNGEKAGEISGEELESLGNGFYRAEFSLPREKGLIAVQPQGIDLNASCQASIDPTCIETAGDIDKCNIYTFHCLPAGLGPLTHKCYGRSYMDREIVRKITSHTTAATYTLSCMAAATACYVPAIIASLGLGAVDLAVGLATSCIMPGVMMAWPANREEILDKLSEGKKLSDVTLTKNNLKLAGAVLLPPFGVKVARSLLPRLPNWLRYATLNYEKMKYLAKVVQEESGRLKWFKPLYKLERAAARKGLVDYFNLIFGTNIKPEHAEKVAEIVRDEDKFLNLLRLRSLLHDAAGPKDPRVATILQKVALNKKLSEEEKAFVAKAAAISGLTRQRMRRLAELAAQLESVEDKVIRGGILREIDDVLREAGLKVKSLVEGSMDELLRNGDKLREFIRLLRDEDALARAVAKAKGYDKVENVLKLAEKAKQGITDADTEMEKIVKSYEGKLKVKALALDVACTAAGIFAGTVATLKTVPVDYKTLWITAGDNYLNLDTVKIPLGVKG